MDQENSVVDPTGGRLTAMGVPMPVKGAAIAPGLGPRRPALGVLSVNTLGGQNRLQPQGNNFGKRGEPSKKSAKPFEIFQDDPLRFPNVSNLPPTTSSSSTELSTILAQQQQQQQQQHMLRHQQQQLGSVATSLPSSSSCPFNIHCDENSENVPPPNVGAPLRKASATQNLTTSASSSSLMMRSTSQDSHTSSWSGSDTARLPFSIFREQQSEDDEEEEMESAIPSPYARQQRNRRRNRSALRAPLQDLPVPLPPVVQDHMNASMTSCHDDANNASMMEVSQDKEDDDDEEVVVVDNEEDEVVAADDSATQALLSASVLEEQNDALDMQDYQADIYQYLRQFELKHAAKWNYMTKQPDITFGMRAILVDWLVEVGEEYKLHCETLHLAVNYIDRFLSVMSVQRGKLQLVGTACMFIAAKYEEIYPPDVSEFVYITDDTYSKKQVLRMEHLVLKVLNFDLAVCTQLAFVTQFSRAAESSEEAKLLSQYLSELTLLEAEEYLCHRSSHIAAACVALARHTMGIPAWPCSVEEMSGLKVEDFKECIVQLHTTFTKAPEMAQQAIREKYKQPKMHGVADIAPTDIF